MIPTHAFKQTCTHTPKMMPSAKLAVIPETEREAYLTKIILSIVSSLHANLLVSIDFPKKLFYSSHTSDSNGL